MKVINGGIQTYTEDWPGRLNYVSRGVAQAGPVDSFALRAANLILGNQIGEVGLEVIVGFFEAQFTEDTVIALTGADTGAQINGQPVLMWESIRVRRGDRIKLGGLKGAGMASYIGIAGGINLPTLWGSKSTCSTEGYGGFKGRKLTAGDELELGKPLMSLSSLENRKFKKSLIPKYQTVVKLRATPGPNSAPDFFTDEGMELWFNQPFKVDNNSNRGAYRLRNPKPIFARKSGGAAGRHPAMTAMQPYRTPGALNIGGDTAALLFVDAVTAGGYVCPLSVITADLWKIGQALPLKNSVEFCYCTQEEARDVLIEQDNIFKLSSLE